MMCHQAIQIGELHWNKFLCILIYCGNNISFYRMIELTIHKLEHFPNRIEFIWSIHIIVNDKIGQSPVEFDNMIDNIFKVVCRINIHKGKKYSCNILPNTTPTY